MEFEPLIEKRRERLKELELVMSAEDFYSDTKRVAEVSREYNQNKQLLEDWEKFSNARRQLKENHDLVKGDDETNKNPLALAIVPKSSNSFGV